MTWSPVSPSTTSPGGSGCGLKARGATENTAAASTAPTKIRAISLFVIGLLLVAKQRRVVIQVDAHSRLPGVDAEGVEYFDRRYDRRQRGVVTGRTARFERDRRHVHECAKLRAGDAD